MLPGRVPPFRRSSCIFGVVCPARVNAAFARTYVLADPAHAVRVSSQSAVTCQWCAAHVRLVGDLTSFGLPLAQPTVLGWTLSVTAYVFWCWRTACTGRVVEIPAVDPTS